MQAEGVERVMGDDDLIVSKTDLKGRIAYANHTFLEIAGFSMHEVIGEPHSLIRSQAMPRAVFKLLWDRLLAGREIFAFVVNRTKPGDHYWVFAHVTPSRDANGQIVSYHSNRRRPQPGAVAEISKLYSLLLAEEARHRNRKEGLAASSALLDKLLEAYGGDYDRFVLSI